MHQVSDMKPGDTFYAEPGYGEKGYVFRVTPESTLEILMGHESEARFVSLANDLLRMTPRAGAMAHKIFIPLG